MGGSSCSKNFNTISIYLLEGRIVEQYLNDKIINFLILVVTVLGVLWGLSKDRKKRQHEHEKQITDFQDKILVITDNFQDKITNTVNGYQDKISGKLETMASADFQFRSEILKDISNISIHDEQFRRECQADNSERIETIAKETVTIKERQNNVINKHQSMVDKMTDLEKKSIESYEKLTKAMENLKELFQKRFEQLSKEIQEVSQKVNIHIESHLQPTISKPTVRKSVRK